MCQTHERPVPTPSHSRHLPAPQSQLLHATKIQNYKHGTYLQYDLLHQTQALLSPYGLLLIRYL